MLKRRFHSDDEKKQNKLQRQIERFENNKFIKFINCIISNFYY